jgi:hypothetical protein
LHSRTKRSYAAAFKGLTHIATMAATGYTVYKTEKMEKEIRKTKSQVSDVLKASVKFSETQLNKHNQKINELVNEQNCIKLKTSLIEEEISFTEKIKINIDELNNLRNLDPSNFLNSSAKLLLDKREVNETPIIQDEKIRTFRQVEPVEAIQHKNKLVSIFQILSFFNIFLKNKCCTTSSFLHIKDQEISNKIQLSFDNSSSGFLPNHLFISAKHIS